MFDYELLTWSKFNRRVLIAHREAVFAAMTRLILALFLVSALSAPAAHAQDGNVEAGLAYAQATCAKCHAVRKGGELSPNPGAPTFSAIANTPGMTGAALLVILQTPHEEMPDLIIPAKEKAGLVAYILSLKR